MRPEDEDANHPGYCASRCPDVVRADQRPGDPSLTISRDPDAVLSADNVGKRLAGASKMLRNDSARISNPNNVASKVALKIQRSLHRLCIARAGGEFADGAKRRKASPFPFLRQR